MPLSLASAESITTSGSSQRFTTVLVAGAQYRLTCSENCWIILGTGSETASDGGSNCHLVVKGQAVGIAATGGNTRVSVIHDGTAGQATLSLIGY